VFFADSDCELYLELLRKYFIQFRVDIAGYSLMSNHIHQVLIPALANSLAKGVGRLHNDFARWQQIQRNLSGHLWQNRFFSTPLKGAKTRSKTRMNFEVMAPVPEIP
jgi:putative transposase